LALILILSALSTRLPLAHITRDSPLLSLFLPCFTVSQQMAETSTTLRLNDLAPDFTLGAANTSATYCLSEFLRQGPIVLEFLRGTW
jgi:hypothetical protein